MSSETIMWWNFESRERGSGVKAAAERLMLESAREMFMAYMQASLLCCSTGIFSIDVCVV